MVIHFYIKFCIPLCKKSYISSPVISPTTMPFQANTFRIHYGWVRMIACFPTCNLSRNLPLDFIHSRYNPVYPKTIIFPVSLRSWRWVVVGASFSTTGRPQPVYWRPRSTCAPAWRRSGCLSSWPRPSSLTARGPSPPWTTWWRTLWSRRKRSHKQSGGWVWFSKTITLLG